MNLSVRKEIRLAGQGGQGVIVAGQILAKSAFNAFPYVSNVVSYGPEVRGTNTYSDVILSESFISFPYCQCIDVLVAFSQSGMNNNINLIDKNALIIYDDNIVAPNVGNKTISVPATKLSVSEFGTNIYANSIMFGVFVKHTGIVSGKDVKKVLKTSNKNLENLKAFETGFNW